MNRRSLRPLARLTLHRTLVLAGAATLAVASVAGPVAAGPSGAKPFTTGAGPTGAVPGGFASWADLIRTQEKLNAAAEKIVDAKGAGYAGIVAAPENHELRVYWKGATPAPVSALINRLDRAVPISVLPAAFSEVELTAAAQRLATVPNVASASPKADGSGVQVSTTGDVSTAAPIRDAVVPVTVVVGDKVVATYDRQADTPNYYGGGRFWSPGGGCTTGFSINVGGGQNMLTAGHCGENGQSVTTGASVTMGTINNKVACRDTEIIYTGSWGRVFTGGPYSGTSIAVGGAAASFVGNFINTDGSTSGEHSSVQVTATNVYAAIGGIPCGSVGPLVQARQTGGTCAVAPGDSGGPVIAYRSDGKVNALGTMTAGAVTASCPGTIYSPGYNYVYYAPILDSLALYGASITIT